MSTKTRISLIALLGLPLLAVAPACAGTVYTDFGAGFVNNATNSSYYGIIGSTFFGYAGYAVPFIPNANFNITSVDVLMADVPQGGLSAEVSIGIYTDVDNAPGALVGELSTLTINYLTAVNYNTGSCLASTDKCVYNVPVNDGRPVPVTDGTEYWLAILPAQANTATYWYSDPTSNSSTPATYEAEGFTPGAPNTPRTSWEPGPSNESPYYDIIGNQTGGAEVAPGGGITLSIGTPEPASLALLGLGLGALVLRRRQRSR